MPIANYKRACREAYGGEGCEWSKCALSDYDAGRWQDVYGGGEYSVGGWI
jgi:hypothetical protein